MLGIISEDIVRIWCKSEKSKYRDLGRPSLYNKNGSYTHITYDFTLQNKKNKEIYIAEMKCETQYDEFSYIKLDSSEQLTHHSKKAFKELLFSTRNLKEFKENYLVKVGKPKETITIEGTILIWGSVDRNKIKKDTELKKFTDILSLEEMVNDLNDLKNEEYEKYMEERVKWLKEFTKEMIRQDK